VADPAAPAGGLVIDSIGPLLRQWAVPDDPAQARDRRSDPRRRAGGGYG
jgi:hypothetical protein